MIIRLARRFCFTLVGIGLSMGTLGFPSGRCWGQHGPHSQRGPGSYGPGHHGGGHHGGGAGYVPRYTVPPTFRPSVPSYGYVNPTYRSGASSFGFSIQSGRTGFSYQSYPAVPTYALGLGYGVPSYSSYRIVVPVLPSYQPLYPELGSGRVDPYVPYGVVSPLDAGVDGGYSRSVPANPYPGSGGIAEDTLRPGMILPDGAQVLSVGPTHGGAGTQVPSGAAKPPIGPVPSDGSIKL